MGGQKSGLVKPVRGQEIPGSLNLSDLDLLDDMLNKDKAPAAKIWATYLDLLKKADENPNWGKISAVRIRNRLANTKFFRYILVASCNFNPSQRPSALPDPRTILETFIQRGVMRGWWRVVFAAQLECFSNLSLAEFTSSNSTGGYPLVMEHIKEILDVWSYFFRTYNMQRVPEGRWVPAFKEIEASCRKNHPRFNDKFAQCLPDYKLQMVASRYIAPAALILFDHLETIEASLGTKVFSRELLKDRNSGFEFFFAYLIHHTKRPTEMLWGPSDADLVGNPRSNSKGKILFKSPHDYEVTQEKWEHLVQRADYVLQKRPFERSMYRPSVSPVLQKSSPEDSAYSGAQNSNDDYSVETNNISEVPESTVDRPEESSPIPDVQRSPLVEPEEDTSLRTPIHQGAEDDSITSQLDQIKSALSRITSRRNLKVVISLWDRFQGIIDQTSDSDVGRERLYSKFLLSFFEVGQAQLAVQVWNHMLRSNTKPAQEHWQIMLVGCRKIKDYASMQQIWQNMINSGIQPDIQSWTEWIHGSILCGKWKRGLQALDEVCRTFSPSGKSENEQIHGISQPLCAPINAALSALVAVGKIAEADDVLKWAKKDIGQFNTTTFNIVLRPAVRAGQHETVQRVLKDMQAHHCSPGVVTFTILLDGLIRNPTSSFHTRSFDEQQKLITDMIYDLETNGLKANAHTYGTMLDGLLGTKPPNIIAARAVLAHMAANNIKASAHVCTILISHYFSSNPPDLAAIDGLWKRIKSERGSVDHIFYDRMIEGYGRIGEVERMLEFLRHMPTEGRRPGWLALCGALRALIRAEEWDMVQDLVRDVTEDDKSSSRLLRGWKGKQEFWDLVQHLRDTGRDVPTPNPA